MSISVATLFWPEPCRWGLRGDPYLWREMATCFECVGMPDSLGALSTVIEDAFVRLTGHPVSYTGHIYLARHAHGGISSGGISTLFWREHGIPLIQARFRAHMQTNVDGSAPDLARTGDFDAGDS